MRLQPLDPTGVRILGGLLGDRQRVNREVTLFHGAEELERAGTLENLRVAAGRSKGERRGMVFSDSDVYKWLEAVAWELGREPSARLETLAREIIELVAAAQEPDGYLNSWCQVVDPAWRWTDLEMGHELYCAGHLIQAGIAFARATDDSSLLAVARRFADLIDEVFRNGTVTGTDGHPEIEVALVELYRHTGERRYLELADVLTSRRGFGTFAGGRFDLRYYQDAEPVREARAIVGHAVRALYLAAGRHRPLRRDRRRGAARARCSRQWDDLVSTKTYLTGGVGSRHYDEAIGEPYELPPDRAYCETCAAIASIMWNWRLLLVTGESRFADLLERTLYNGFLSGLSLDGESFFYANPLQSRSGERRHHWNPVACCPPNIMRLLASLHHYLATTSDGGVQLHQYATSTIRAVVPVAGPVELAVETGYPWSGSVTVEVVACGDAEWTLSLRVPAWAHGAVVDGQPVAPGYAELTRRWRPGDRVVLELDVSPRLTAPNPRIDAVRGCLALERGPVVYCFEAGDLPAGADLADVALQTEAEPADSGPLAPLGGVPAVSVAGVVRDLDGWRQIEYVDVRELPRDGAAAPARLLAVPYFAWANREDGGMRVWVPGSG